MLSMANAGPNTNGSQFFLTLKATPHLDGKHTVFGELASGMALLRRMEDVDVDRNSKPTTFEKVVIADCGEVQEAPKLKADRQTFKAGMNFGASSVAGLREGMEEGEQATVDTIVTLRIHQSANVVEKQCRCRLYLLKSSKRNCSRLLGFDEECNNDICVNHRLQADHVWYETSTGAAGCDWSLSAWDYSSGEKKSLLIVCTFPSADVCKRFRQAHSDARPSAVSAVDYLTQVTDIYKQYNPEKLKTPGFVESTLTKYAGKEDELLSKLKAKYSIGGGLKVAVAAPDDPQCFLDISIGGNPAGRITIRLFKSLMPRIAVRSQRLEPLGLRIPRS
jgi:hypothetical protein